MDKKQLCNLAIAMQEKSYCPYSHFPVGAALECADGTIFTGCNVENIAYAPGVCAERTAVVKAVSEGHRDFVRTAVAGRGADHCVPCGVCRQVLLEFAPHLEVICINGAGDAKSFSLDELLPHAFGG